MKHYLIPCLIITLILSYCKKDDCKEEPIAFKTFETDYGCPDAKNSIEVNLIDNVLFIRADESYDSSVRGACHPDIDFTQYDLIVGKQGSVYMNDTILVEYERGCPKENVNLKITLVQTQTIGPDTVVYNAVIPKLQGNEKLNVFLESR
jgi:hypothetical protein